MLAERVAAVVANAAIRFDVLLDPESRLGAALGFRVVPSGFVFDRSGRLRYRREADFDLASAEVLAELECVLRGEGVASAPRRSADPRALEYFANGVGEYALGHLDAALAWWRDGLAYDPDNFVIRSQIWAVEHPDRFWPVVDRDWQERQLKAEGYDGTLP